MRRRPELGTGGFLQALKVTSHQRRIRPHRRRQRDAGSGSSSLSADRAAGEFSGDFRLERPEKIFPPKYLPGFLVISWITKLLSVLEFLEDICDLKPVLYGDLEHLVSGCVSTGTGQGAHVAGASSTVSGTPAGDGGMVERLDGLLRGWHFRNGIWLFSARWRQNVSPEIFTAPSSRCQMPPG